MKRFVKVMAETAAELWSLLVDDGVLAAAALLAIAAAYVLSRDAALGAVDVVGWLLVGLISLSQLISVRRAVSRYNRSIRPDANKRPSST